jgi:broad specificity phosphatase PhoE
MRKLYLIRHGQCRDGAHRCIGGTDLPLDEVGLCQAELSAAVGTVQTADRSVHQPALPLPGDRPHPV